MKRGFKTLVGVVVCLLVFAAHAQPAWAKVSSAQSPGPAIDNAELKLRFLAAMARAREPQKMAMHERQRLSALQFVEKETGLDLGVARMVEDAMARDPNIKMGAVSANRGGIGKRLPEVAKLTFATAGERVGSELKLNSQPVSTKGMKRTPEMEMAGFFLLAGALIDDCRADEPKANGVFLKQIAAQPWPKGQGTMLHASLVAGMYRNGCISRAEFNEIYNPMVPVIRERASGKAASPGTMAGTLFFLLATDKLNGITDERLQEFVRSQSSEGTWADDVQQSNASTFAAVGAAVIAHMLKARGVKVAGDEIKQAYANPPVLAGPKPKKVTP
jgi:hypothetical protein